MKLLFLSSYAHLALDPAETRVSGGAELQVALMARELAARGHDCVLVCGDHGQADDRTLQGAMNGQNHKRVSGCVRSCGETRVIDYSGCPWNASRPP